MKKTLLSFAAIVVFGQVADGATINWANGGSRGHAFVTSTGARLSIGSLVRVGYFEQAGNIASPFIEFGTTTIGNPGPNPPFDIGGHIPSAGKSIPNNTVAGNTMFADRQLYLWVYNAADSASATESEIFTSTTWRTPAGFTDNAATFNIILGVTQGGTIPPAQALQDGSVTNLPITINSGATPTNTSGLVYSLGQIPEPTSVGLMALAGLALMRRKRN